jgi:hypothetical protein
MQDGMNCLLQTLGSHETEVFVWNLLKEPFDYTEWQRSHFADTTLEEFNRKAAEYDKKHPWVVGQGSDG